LDKDPNRVHEIFRQEVLKVVQQWMDLADKKLNDTDLKVFCSPGNDDMEEVDEIIVLPEACFLSKASDFPRFGS